MMNLELLNVFISATTLVFNNYGMTMKRERLSIDTVPKTNHEMNVIFGFNGAISCTVVMGMSYRAVRKLATVVLRDPVYDLEFAGNAIIAVGSDICTTIIDNMNQIGIDVFPRSATLINGMGIALSTLNVRKVVISFEAEIGQFDLRITVE